MNHIAYRVGNGLYLNITNRCSNNCIFCIRRNGDGAYGSESLWLEYEPSEDEIWRAVVDADPSKYEEVVFCGYGEPTYRMDVMCSIARRIKETYGSYVRVNTNGQSSLINLRDTAPEFSVFDCVSVSLNAPTAEKYQKICLSRFGEGGFDAMLRFTKDVKKYSRKVVMSVVKEFLTQQEIDECISLCKSIGIEIRIRNYIS